LIEDFIKFSLMGKGKKKGDQAMKSLVKITVMMGAALFFSSPLYAFSDGDPGETSTGTSDISVTIPNLVRISGMADITATYTGAAGGVDENFDLCVYSNMDTGGAGSYSVRMTSTSPWGGAQADEFVISNAANTAEVEYAVEWNNQAGTGGSSVDYDDPLTGQTGWSNATDCGGTDNANIRVQMTQADLLAVLPGVYTSTLTVVIAPE